MFTVKPLCYHATLFLQFAFIYFFNLHLGQGIIILPKLISKTGLLLSTLLIAAIASVNFVTSSHVLEAMGIANALEVRRKRGLPNAHAHKTTNVSNLIVNCGTTVTVTVMVDYVETGNLSYLTLNCILFKSLYLYSTATSRSSE